MSYTLLGEARAPNGTTSSLEVDSIPATYRHLQCIIAGSGNHLDSPNWWTGRFNDFGGGGGEAIYEWAVFIMNATSGAYPWVTGDSGTADQFYFGYNSGVSPYDVQGITVVDIYGYASTTRKKQWSSYGGTIDETGTSDVGNTMFTATGSIPFTAAVNKISINMAGNNMQTGCTLRVFGWGAP